MADLVITHSDAEGTLIDGTTRGDGSAEVLKANRWRWSRNLGSWFVPQSRDRAPKTWIITPTADALRAAGFTVDVELDETPRDQAAAETAKVERADERASRLRARAERHRSSSEQLQERADQISNSIPMGQPILVGHHSERRHRKDLERLHSYTSKSWEEEKAANQTARAAQIAAAAADRRNNPRVVANRIDRLAAEVRAAERAGTSDRHQHEVAQLEYWQQVRAAQLADGTAANHSAATIRPGDSVTTSRYGPRLVVVRANKTTVTVAYPVGDGTCHGRIKYHQIVEHSPAVDDAT